MKHPGIVRRTYAREAGRDGGDAARAERRASGPPSLGQGHRPLVKAANTTGAHSRDWPTRDAIDADAKDEQIMN